MNVYGLIVIKKNGFKQKVKVKLVKINNRLLWEIANRFPLSEKEQGLPIIGTRKKYWNVSNHSGAHFHYYSGDLERVTSCINGN